MGISENPFLYFKGVLSGIAIALLWSYISSPTLAHLERDFAAYDQCMKLAGTMHCHMDTEDFIRYYDIKQQIAAAHGDES